MRVVVQPSVEFPTTWRYLHVSRRDGTPGDAQALSGAGRTTAGVAAMSRTLGELLAARLLAIRQAAGVTQEAVARAAVQHGFRWGRLTVRDVERGARRLTVEEFAVLPAILDAAGCGTLSRRGPRLLNDDDEVELAPGLVVVGRDLRMPTHRRVVDAATRQAHVAVQERKRRERAEDDEVFEAVMRVPAPDDAEAKATMRLRERLGRPDLSVVDVQLAAEGLWGRRLADERDARIADQQGQLPPRRLQAARGFTTRALLDELADAHDSRGGTVWRA